jgi:hypothetical protein
MPFVKGHNKLGGRDKGIPNRTSRTLIAQLEEYGMGSDYEHPVVWMFKVAHNTIELQRTIDGVTINNGTTPEIRFQCMKEVAKYVSPQLKAVDHTISGDQESPIKHSVEYTVVYPKDNDTAAI